MPEPQGLRGASVSGKGSRGGPQRGGKEDAHMCMASEGNAHECMNTHARVDAALTDRPGQPRTRPRGAPSPVAHSAGKAITRPQNKP